MLIKVFLYFQHSPMSCLSDVLTFFIQQAGPGTSAMRTNDLRKMGLSMSSQGHRGQGHRGRHHHDDDSGFDDPLGELFSRYSTS